ncbi:hypothetical protein DICPUDRAFT_90467 [Dictyostelium purpureum]|uniref:EF-hand domain-containing protein n=1 Tax=Dictyostelium purpureum TaxID=5786 RepID=F1A2S4_DICPU|nr:uncharacterized protein DICPUDRAFT_90467 [Dictyostelium purpureum]EGC29508.1 hypothetical protein DICPUDRAFT_90467 [Dictyostelium purpureum]|eukprot:XP_003293968.1 hypothetical protein DICPUDRAFT_90467 [Dictyostelium purpureum]
MATVSDVCKKIEQDVESMLKKYDRDGDKSLTLDEITDYLCQNKVKNPERTAYMIFKRLDTNNGKCSKIKSKELEDAIKREVADILKFYDQNEDKRITFDEMVESLIKSGGFEREAAKNTATFYFDEIDTDKDKVLTIAELKKYCGSLANPQQ